MLNGLLWIASQYALRGYCVTFARGLDELEMLRRLGGNLSRPWWWLPCGHIDELQGLEGYEEFESAEDLELFGPILQVGRDEDWAFAIEWSYPWESSRPEVLRAVSTGTVAVSVQRDSEAVAQFGYAEDGVLIARFDPLLLRARFSGDDPAWTLPLMEGKDPARIVPFLHQAGIFSRQEGYMEAMFALTEAMGVRLEEEAVAEKLLLTGEMIPLPEERV